MGGLWLAKDSVKPELRCFAETNLSAGVENLPDPIAVTQATDIV
jgi:hypothetical protein